MKQSMKRLLSLLLVLAMVVTLLPANVQAKEQGEVSPRAEITERAATVEEIRSIPEPEEIPADSGDVQVYINPRFAGQMEETELRARLEQARLQATPASQTEAVTVEEAIVLLRESMVKREESFAVTVFSENPVSDFQNIVFSALEHTGNPKEGDYLRMQLKGWSTGFDILHYGDGGVYYSIRCGMVFDTNAAQEAEVDAAVEQILADLDVYGKSDYEKIKAVYDWVCANVVYDHEHLEDDSYWIKQTAYGALIYGTCVCEGYALLVYRLALEVGVDCRMIVGTSLTEPHAWNIAKLAGWYYYLDATWDAGTHPNDYIWFLMSGPIFNMHAPEFQDWAFAIDYTGNAFREAYPYAPSGSDPTDPDGPFDDDTAVSGFCGDQATWSFDSTTGRLTVSGTGEMYSYLPTTRRPWEHLSDRIREVLVEGTVERVGAYAFAGLEALTSLVMEPGVTSVGGHAVMGCNRLASVTIPASVTEMGVEIFRDCSLLTSAGPIGSGAAVEFGWTAEIPNNTFYGMFQLTAVTLPDMLATVGRYAFAQTGLSEIVIPDSVTLVGKGAFEKSSLTRVHVGSGVEVIGAYAFRHCRNLNGITLEQGVQEIGDQALEGCVSLTAVTIPESVTRLGEYAFAFCTALTVVEFLGTPPVFDRVAAGEYSNVFYFVTANVFCYYDHSWTKDTMLNYGGTLTWVFRERNSVTQDDLTWEYDPANRQLTVRGSGLMADYILNRESETTAPWAAHSQDVRVIVLEEGVTHIGNYAFYGFSQLRQIVIPESVETIGQCALEGCERMPAVRLPSALRSVGRFAFRGAAELFVVNFGPALEVIREKAFENCARLATVTFSGDEPTLEDEVFGRSKAGIRYPAANDTWDTLPGYGGGVGNYWRAYGSAEGELGRGTFGNGLAWVVDGDGVLTITGSGPMPDYTNADYYEIPWRAYNEKIAKIVVGEGVETIGSRVFEETIYTTEVTLPETLVSINEYAFQGMYCLNTLIIPDSVTHIGNNAVSIASSLQYLTLGSQLQSIDSEAFAFSSSLYRIELPASLQSIEAGAFGSCGNLVRIEVDPNSNSFWSDEQGVLYSKDRTTLFQMGGGYQGAYRVDAATTVIAGNACKEVKGLTEVRTQGEVCQVGNFAFYGCENLQLADLGGSLESIGEYAFGRCFKLSGFDFGDKLTVIGDYGFYQCESLNQIALPDTMQTVGLSAFEYCGLTRIDLGNGIRSMGDNAFRGNEITELVIPASLEEVGACVFQLNAALESVTFEPGLSYVAERMFDQCSALETVTLTDTITELRAGAFSDCVELDGIELPDSITRIESAFSGCIALRDVRMSAGLETLGEYAFSDCTVLERIVLPKTLVTMDAGCFSGCTALKEVIIPASLKVQSVSTVLFGTFSNCTGLDTVIFMGDAPAIYLQYAIFGGVEATAYYPGDNATWTEEIRTNFGGTINWIPVTIYPMLTDSDTTATVGSADAFSVHCEGNLADLVDVRVDGEVVDPANYTAAEGSTIITFADSYLQSLDSGLHTVRLTFTDGLSADVFDLVGGNSHMHSYTAVVTEPTCQAQGYTTYTCECGDSYVGNYVDGDHVYTSVVTDPTCEEKGYTTHTCSVCGYSYQDKFVPEIGHYYTGNSVDPTCEEEGYTIWRCANCGHSYTEYYGEPLGHDYVDGVCTRCYQDDPNYDPEEPDEEEVQYPITGTCGENVTWRLDADGTLTISGTGDMEDYDHMYLQPWVDYADKIKRGVVEGTVNRIGERAFFNLQQLTSVTIEEGVTEIAEYAFWIGTNLTSVTIPESVTTIGYYAFRDCYKLTSAGPVGGGYHIEFAWTEEIPENAFFYSNCLETAVMPESMRVIRDCAFAYSGLREIELNDGLETIGYSAFMNCYYLTSLKIPASVSAIESGAFSDCTGLTDVYFLGSAPEEFSSNAFDGVTATMWYPAGDASWENLWFRDNENGLTWQSYNAANPPWEETDPSEPTEPSDPTEPTEPEDPEVSELNGMFRLAGPSRYDTGFAIANKLKEILGVDKFSAVIVAYGQNFPDALTGSYLAAVKGAPILLTEPSADANLLNYLKTNLVSGGKVYILGGTAAVSQKFEDGAKDLGFDVKRLKGAGRYETNLEILKEAGVNTTDEVLIATGKNYADSLSASATGLPMLLVDKNLTDSQKAFLQGTSKKFVILGGTGAVSAEVEAELDAIGDVTRVKGASRYGTSVEIAKRYFNAPSAAVLAYAQGFPDGLCGGPLAYAVGAPLILTSNESSTLADEYVAGISNGAVTGGTARISDDTVRNIFELPSNTPIVKP